MLLLIMMIRLPTKKLEKEQRQYSSVMAWKNASEMNWTHSVYVGPPSCGENF